MTNRVLTSTNGTISIVTTTAGFCNVDVATILSNQVSDLATYFSNGVINTVAVSVVNATSIGVAITNSQVVIGNSSVNTTANSTHFFSGNSTVYGYSNSTAEGIVNSSGNSVTTPTTFAIFSNVGTITIGNSTINGVSNSSTYAFNYPGVIITRPLCSVLNAGHNLIVNSNTAAQNVFPAGQMTVTLAANTTYLIDAAYMVSNAADGVATALQTGFGNSVAIGTLFYNAIGCVANNDVPSAFGAVNALTTSVYAISPSLTTVTATAPSTVSNLTATVLIKGALTTAAATTFTPQLAYTVACNATPLILTGSYITLTPVSNSTAGTCNLFGTWA